MASSWDQIASVLGREEKRRAEIKREIVSKYICVYVYVYLYVCERCVLPLELWSRSEESRKSKAQVHTDPCCCLFYFIFF